MIALVYQLLVLGRQLVVHVTLLIGTCLHVVHFLLSALVFFVIFCSCSILPQNDVLLMFELYDFEEVLKRLLKLLFGEFDEAKLITYIPIGNLSHLSQSAVALLFYQGH